MNGVDCILEVYICLLREILSDYVLIGLICWKKIFACFSQKGRFLILSAFNARAGKSSYVNDVIVMFGEVTCNSNGILLIKLLQICHLMICNGRTLLCDPKWN